MIRIAARISPGLLVLPIIAAASPAMGQWWWPPDVSVQPPCIHPNSMIEVTLSGDWPDNCVPNRVDVDRIGSEIDLDVDRDPPPGFCLSVITPWSLPVELSPLPSGTYSVYATYYISGQPATQRVFLRTIVVEPVCAGACYANCDNSTTPPILNVDDFTCFINEFAAAQGLPHEQQIEHYANCDDSTTAPVLNVDDFTCFINAFAAGCP